MYKSRYDIVWINGKSIDLTTATQEELKRVHAILPKIVIKENVSIDTEPSESNSTADAE
jgi:hypothetical protein